MKLKDLLDLVKNADDHLIIKEAYNYAEKHLQGSMRLNGDTMLSHSLEVASILAKLNVDATTIVCALLHETVSNGTASYAEIEKLFGPDVHNIILSVRKITTLELADDSENSAIYLRKVMVGLSEDVRVLFIKLADRLHNMRTMASFSVTHQKKVASETLSVLVPIAHRLGINSIKSELENLSLFYQKPDVYNDILEKLNNTAAELNEYLQEMKTGLSDLLTENEIKFEIKGRVKSVYSIYNKLQNGKKWNDIYDILALRIFVEKESDCYAVVGLIHSKYKPLPKRFKDYIALPKENMYQSLHTTVSGPGGKLYEVQIRTYEMDEIAEKGIASHWSYKEKGTKKIQTIMEQKLELYRSIIETASEKADSEFASLIDDEILNDLIYVYTPKGDVVELPKGATPIDFAYRIHSKVGDSMIGAIVNDNMISITSSLNDGDTIRIMTSNNGKPKKDWLNYVKTPQAKNKIKAYFSKIDKDNYILRGKEKLEKEIRRRKLSISDTLNNENINRLCTSLKLKDLDDVYLAIGSLRYTPVYIINFLVGNEENVDSLVIKPVNSKKPKANTDIFVDNKTMVTTHLAKCCHPIKGDNICGIITKTDGIAVHRESCPNVSGLDDKIVHVSWNEESTGFYQANLILNFSSDKDKITEIFATVAGENANVLSILEESKGLYNLKIMVKDMAHLEEVLKVLRKLRYIKGVKRK